MALRAVGRELRRSALRLDRAVAASRRTRTSSGAAPFEGVPAARAVSPEARILLSRVPAARAARQLGAPFALGTAARCAPSSTAPSCSTTRSRCSALSEPSSTTSPQRRISSSRQSAPSSQQTARARSTASLWARTPRCCGGRRRRARPCGARARVEARRGGRQGDARRRGGGEHQPPGELPSRLPPHRGERRPLRRVWAARCRPAWRPAAPWRSASRTRGPPWCIAPSRRSKGRGSPSA